MQVSETNVSSLPWSRSLKIQSILRINRRSQTIIPEIKLSGRWLSEIGFTPDQRVNITIVNNALVIDLEK
ncbi:toxic protein SymE [Pedobacter cryoconitis]|uniref:Toxic protein SymE n=1 Tax=Pedobacter cryoconitis TaxID=188932 RepID=A0A7W9DLX3_9SPHI|nr:SymE family type I addiction module toxin [Pedobacter cryoconitis]MBB5622600.1 toxic protein SymE [Pedobacter cryoconitis]MBB5648752.1 toxic protein SymE [Pedobacter cryoconitis]